MNPTWILILMVYSQPLAIPTHYESQGACMDAGQYSIEELSKRIGYLVFSDVKFVCIPGELREKGDKNP